MIEEHNISKNRYICNALKPADPSLEEDEWVEEVSSNVLIEDEIVDLYNWISQFIDGGQLLVSEYINLLAKTKSVVWEDYAEESPAIIAWSILLDDYHCKHSCEE